MNLLMKSHLLRFTARHTPVRCFWGTFDLAYARYSGRPADPPAAAGLIARRSADAEQICCGFWPGHAELPEPAFFAYTYPKPEGIERTAGWNTDLAEFALSYEDVRKSPSPRDQILRFFESTYAAGAELRCWDEHFVP